MFRRLLVAAALVVVAVAWVRARWSYPSGWAPIRWHTSAVLTARCPDVTGTYDLVATEGRVHLSQSIFARFVGDASPRWPWETIALTGDANDSLVVTVARSPRQVAAYRDHVSGKGAYYEQDFNRMHEPSTRWSGGFGLMSDSAYQENLFKLFIWPRRRYTLVRDRDYRCSGGWLRGDRVIHDPGPDRSRPRPDTVIGEILFRKDRAGFLVAKAEYPEHIQLNVWCGDACNGPSVGTWTMHQWAHWPPATAWDGVVARPWAEEFQPPPPRPAERDLSVSSADFATEVRRVLPEGVQLQSVARDGREFRVQVVSPATLPFTRMLERLHGGYRFRGYQVMGLTRTAEGGWEMTLRLGDIWQHSPGTPGRSQVSRDG